MVVDIKADDVNSIIGFLEEKCFDPETGVNVLICTLYRILEANGCSKIEMCRRVNEIIMSMQEISTERVN